MKVYKLSAPYYNWNIGELLYLEETTGEYFNITLEMTSGDCFSDYGLPSNILGEATEAEQSIVLNYLSLSNI